MSPLFKLISRDSQLNSIRNMLPEEWDISLNGAAAKAVAHRINPLLLLSITYASSLFNPY